MTATRELGDAYLDALERRDFGKIEACFHPEVTFRALVPPGLRSDTSPSGAVARVRAWFGDADEVVVTHRVVDQSTGRLHLAYRVELVTDGVREVVEQHAFCTLRDGLIHEMDLLCSGFIPLSAAELGIASDASGGVTPRADAVLEAPGKDCATLTPLIRGRIREMESGSVLEVRTDDPTAAVNLQAWSRLTGNELVATIGGGSRRQQFFIRKK